ncbi:MAG: metal-dependent transcriptional regulator [Ruthenibacterium sp.]
MALHTSGEDYLEAVLVLKQQLGMVRSVDVARHLNVTKASVTNATRLLREGGFLRKDYEGFWMLTPLGREVAEKTYEKHCFFRKLLTDAGVDPKLAERDACRMEHGISEESFEKLKIRAGRTAAE